MNQKARNLLYIATLFALATCFYPSQASAAWTRGHFYIIGTGPAGPRTATMQALETIKQMDVILAYDMHQKLFADHIGDKPVLFDPWEGLFGYKGKAPKQLSKKELDEFKVERFRLRDERIAKIKALLAQERTWACSIRATPACLVPAIGIVSTLIRQT